MELTPTPTSPREGVYLQYGCGLCAPLGWLNFDASPALALARTPLLGRTIRRWLTPFPPNARFGDIRNRPLLPEGSVTGLYASHVLEHLSYEDALAAISASYVLLRPGGIFRLIVPDLQARAQRYVDAAARGDPRAARVFMEGTGLGRRRTRRGPLGVARQLLGNSEHLWMWDAASMADALRASGFVEIRRCRFGDSQDPRFAEVEDEGRFTDGGSPELAFECRRPLGGARAANRAFELRRAVPDDRRTAALGPFAGATHPTTGASPSASDDLRQ